MQEEIATVISNTDGVVEITTQIQSTCSGCEQNSHCGTGLLARYLAPKPENLKLSSDLHLVAGQKVKIGLSESLLLKLAGLIYLVPVLLMVIFASMFSIIMPGVPEIWHVLFSFLCCGAYFVVIRYCITAGILVPGEPQILQVFSDEETPIKIHDI